MHRVTDRTTQERGSSAELGAPARKGWQAKLTLHIDGEGPDGRTRIAHCHHFGPLRIQRPFYPGPDGRAHIYLLHPPGGVVMDDELEIHVTAAEGAAALLTTPGATKFYRSLGPSARQRTSLTVQDGACLEWFPQETILFSGSEARIATSLELSGNACAAAWEFVCFGRPAANALFDRGSVHASLEVRREGRPLFVERGRLSGSSASEVNAGHDSCHARSGLRGYTVMGTMVCTADTTRLEQNLVCPSLKSGMAAVTQVGELGIARYLGDRADEGRYWMSRLWTELRPQANRGTFMRPAIWNT